MNELLISKIKDILLDTPIDIYNPDENTNTQSMYELQQRREGSKYIGSANLFIAASLYCYVTRANQFNQMSEEDLEMFSNDWKALLTNFENEGFLKEIGTSNLKVIVDNTK